MLSSQASQNVYINTSTIVHNHRTHGDTDTHTRTKPNVLVGNVWPQICFFLTDHISRAPGYLRLYLTEQFCRIRTL